MTTIELPDVVTAFCKAHSALREHFASTELTFTLDGKLIGDIGEAIAAQHFGLKLCAKRTKGVDAHALDGRSVQIKATGSRKNGPAFNPGRSVADHLLFLRIDFSTGFAEVAYNGPEAPVRDLLPRTWTGTLVIPLSKILAADALVTHSLRLPAMIVIPSGSGCSVARC